LLSLVAIAYFFALITVHFDSYLAFKHVGDSVFYQAERYVESQKRGSEQITHFPLADGHFNGRRAPLMTEELINSF